MFRRWTQPDEQVAPAPVEESVPTDPSTGLPALSDNMRWRVGYDSSMRPAIFLERQVTVFGVQGRERWWKIVDSRSLLLRTENGVTNDIIKDRMQERSAWIMSVYNKRRGVEAMFGTYPPKSL